MRKVVIPVAALVAVALAFSVAVAEDKAAEPAAAKTAGATAKIGEAAPQFSLKDQNGKTVSLSDFTGKTVVLEWFNQGCPYVVRHHKAKTMTETAAKYKDKDVVWLAINSGAPGEQGAGQDLSAEAVTNWKITYPVLIDESGEVGRSYGAKTTPHMYVVDKDGILRYMGAIDDYQTSKKVNSTNYVKNAVTSVLAGETVEVSTTQSYGCGVKYGKKGGA